MVVNNANCLKLDMVDPRTLKFGMDRILSEGNTPKANALQCKLQIGNNLCPPRHPHLEASASIGFVPEACSSVPPCAGCISSLFRCCRSPHYLDIVTPYEGALRPLGAYSKVPTQAEPRLKARNQITSSSGNGSKRKRSWSRAVFSNLQRKGLEKRFQLQKYITKPDRRQLAATLGLTDAQVKVWFQNRRMKWRHTKECSNQTSPENETSDGALATADSTNEPNTDSESGSDIDVQTLDN